jgi:hypothetical protein
MDKINKLNKVKALLAVGVFSAAVSVALWAWMAHYHGLPIANAVLLMTAWLTNRYYRPFFALTHPSPIQAYDSGYAYHRRIFFLEPFLLSRITRMDDL